VDLSGTLGRKRQRFNLAAVTNYADGVRIEHLLYWLTLIIYAGRRELDGQTSFAQIVD
jgi:hypothetical protein